ncbi:hypothetical protein OPV22_032801 [Ensete ventricosum]|uniref:Transmembrane protein n=1 Tax=Ensete ventricosum TaxID=4639 RepID=A0AAV8PQB3_ENSVE|nr:hypothetical protein OPV22_032801 [Ensete ventricosum]RWW30451.1 hypothetical protein GW17_00004972 [Ensete ventricosum]RWW38748.1 hypothetical protein BHE74_00055992 [Ensete ventricosum]RZS11080.1 hypothetical protein BHM03_00042376 [Ensete ventricosum]
MGRIIPFPSEAHTSLRPSLVVFLVVAWIAAAMAVVLSICATCNRKSSSKQSSSPRSPPSNESVAKPAAETMPATVAQEQDESPAQDMQQQEEQVAVIEMAPDVATHGPLPPTVLPASASKRKLSLSFGRVPERLRTSRRERHGKGNDSEDSLWKKTIILGEKNRISTDDEEEVVDENGNRQRHYHPRTPRSQQTSRNNSFAHPDETPS